jgi:hypothetical protein
MEAKIQKFVSLASSIGMAASSLTMLTNLWDVWSNKDLSTGEKML